MKQLREPMIDHAGNVKVNVPVKVVLAGTSTLASLWNNSNGTGTLDNPINTDTDGLVKAYLADGNYDLIVDPGAVGTFTVHNFQHVDLIGLKSQLVADYAAAVQGAAAAGGAAAAESAVNAARAELTAIIASAVIKDGDGNATLLRAGQVPFVAAAKSGVITWISGGLEDGGNSWGLRFNAAEAFRVDTDGNLLVGVTSGTFHRFTKLVAQSVPVIQFDGGTAISMRVLAVNASGYNGAATAAAFLGKNDANNRSINAGGTINASGADYAEYMTKAAGCGTIAKGNVCGVDANGLLTDKWADALRFVVKSTNPNIVGGDTWAGHLGDRPEQEEDESNDAFALRLAPFEADLEAARQTVDRIAFCGQVPVNFGGSCAPGDYLIPIQDGAGIGVAAVAAADINFAQYRSRLGAVLAIREGRPWIDVQHG